MANGKCDEGIERYKQAWQHAVRAKISPAVHMTGGRLQLEILGEPGRVYVIQASTNLTSWVNLRTHLLSSVSGNFIYTDTNAPAIPNRFYRARYKP